MIIIEIPPNPNCEATERVFHEVAVSRRITRIRLEREPGRPAWYEVTGWTTTGIPCQALAQKVDDSGEGVAFLIYGGDAGLRFRPAVPCKSWDLKDQRQWGEPLLIMLDDKELQYDYASQKKT